MRILPMLKPPLVVGVCAIALIAGVCVTASLAQTLPPPVTNTITLKCDSIPTTYDDGTKIEADAEILFNLYTGAKGQAKYLPANWISSPICQFIRVGIKPGNWCWAVKMQVNGIESEMSGEYCRVFTGPKPKAPNALIITP